MLACTLNKTASTASLVLAWTATGYTAEDHRPNYMQESAAPWMDQQDSRDDTPLWEVTFFHFHSTLNKLDGLYSDDLQFASQNGIGLNLGRVLFRDPFRWPMDITASTKILWHNERGKQDNFLHNTLSIKLGWKSFFWNHWIRTRAEIGNGVSYTGKIPYAEEIARKRKGSRHFLNYMEYSVGFSLRDATEIISRRSHETLEHVWIFTGILHRSGVFGLYGDATDEDGNKGPGTGAWNAGYAGIRYYF